MAHAAAPVSSSALSSDSLSPSTGQASTATDETTSNVGGQSHSTRAAVIGGTIGGVCALFVILLFVVVFWRRRKRRLLREQQIAIRRMTIVGPPSTSPPPILPYPFLGHGPRAGAFASDFEMSTSKGFAVSKPQEAGLPKTKPPIPPRSRHVDRIIRRNDHSLAAHSATADSASIFSSKQSDIGDGHDIAYVDGAYVLALGRDKGQNGADEEKKLASTGK